MMSLAFIMSSWFATQRSATIVTYLIVIGSVIFCTSRDR